MFNILDCIFILLTVVLFTSGFLVNKNIAPKYLLKLWGYGSFSYKGKDMIKWIDVPKSYFSHFYLYATFICVVLFGCMVCLYGSEDVYMYETFNSTFEMLFGGAEKVSVTSTILTTFIFTIHVSRRLYETLYLQVFAKTSKMNVIHYLMGLLHYTACILILVIYAPLFGGCQNKYAIIWTDTNPILYLPFIWLFGFASYQQHRSNVLLANIRKDRKGKIVTGDYNIPQGGWFEYISSPHRFTEIIIYASLWGLHGTLTSFLAFLWVFVNQTQIAIKVHTWYLTEFENYPKHRKAIIPFIL